MDIFFNVKENESCSRLQFLFSKKGGQGVSFVSLRRKKNSAFPSLPVHEGLSGAGVEDWQDLRLLSQPSFYQEYKRNKPLVLE